MTREGFELTDTAFVAGFLKFLVVEPHGCLPDVGLFAVDLDKLEVPVRISADVHELVSVAHAEQRKKNPRSSTSGST
jgi:hypothetical protein